MPRPASARAAPLLCALALAPGAASAAAWTRAPGATFLSFGTGWFRTDGGYEEATASIYVEHGVAEAVTVGGAVELVRPSEDDASTDLTASAFARFRLWRGAAGDPFSVQLGAGAPVGDAFADAPAQTADEPAVEARALYGRGFATGWGDAFVNAEAGVRLRLEESADELRLDLTAGLRPADRWLVMAQSFGTLGLRNAEADGDDFDVLKLAPSVGYEIAPGVTVLFGVERDVAGRNIDEGTRLRASIWTEF
jgi:hypothetical protein